MSKIKTEVVHLESIPFSQRRKIGMLAQRHLENKVSPGTVDSLCELLKTRIAEIEKEENSMAARWLLAHLLAEPELARINCRAYICQLLYDI